MSFIPAPPSRAFQGSKPVDTVPKENQRSLSDASVEKVSSCHRSRSPFPPSIGRRGSFSAVHEKEDKTTHLPKIPVSPESGERFLRQKYVCTIPKDSFLPKIPSPESCLGKGRYPDALHSL